LRKAKLDYTLLCGIDTISVWTNKPIAEGQYSGIKQIRSIHDVETGEIRYNYKINVSTYSNRADIKSLEDYMDALAKTMDELGISELELARCDIKFDSYEDNFSTMFKMNKLLVLLIAHTNNIKNRYESKDPLRLNDLTVRVQNNYLEAENYDKQAQSNYRDNVKNRLELRCKRLLQGNKGLRGCFDFWFKKLDKLPMYYDAFQMLCNTYLIKKWHEENGNKVKSIAEFIRKYESNIYSRKQLIALFGKLGVNNPERAADKFKSNSHIEYITLNDLKMYVRKIKESACDFLG
jgi:hypothetical protein